MRQQMLTSASSCWRLSTGRTDPRAGEGNGVVRFGHGRNRERKQELPDFVQRIDLFPRSLWCCIARESAHHRGTVMAHRQEPRPPWMDRRSAASNRVATRWIPPTLRAMSVRAGACCGKPATATAGGENRPLDLESTRCGWSDRRQARTDPDRDGLRWTAQDRESGVIAL